MDEAEETLLNGCKTFVEFVPGDKREWVGTGGGGGGNGGNGGGGKEDDMLDKTLPGAVLGCCLVENGNNS